jgi:FAD/FMN-containing dehydrogenase
LVKLVWLSKIYAATDFATCQYSRTTVDCSGAAKNTGSRCRAFFTPLVCTDATLLSLDHIAGIASTDLDRCQSSIYAGTRLYDLDQHLQQQSINQALMNQGDIDQQSLAGAVSTGTHGTGADLHCISAYVEAFELLTASGEILKCSRTEHPEIFAAGRVSLGSLGILTKSLCRIVLAINSKNIFNFVQSRT